MHLTRRTLILLGSVILSSIGRFVSQAARAKRVRPKPAARISSNWFILKAGDRQITTFKLANADRGAMPNRSWSFNLDFAKGEISGHYPALYYGNGNLVAEQQIDDARHWGDGSLRRCTLSFVPEQT